ncbi:MAG: AzlC family ABC transporter permease [Rhizobiaceae bacterium]
MPAAHPSPDIHQASHLRWFLRGSWEAVSIPVLMLMSAILGFAGLAREAGFSLGETLFMSAVIWALPAQVVLIGAVMSGASIFGAAFAVALSSIRLLPMVVALVPDLRGPRTRKWVLYALSHFIAITSWVMAQRLLPGVPRDMRTAFYGGLAITIVLANLVVVTVVYLVAADLPPTLSAALLLLTPMYFLTSMWGSARERAGHVALLIGLVLGPAFHAVVPEIDLMATGIVGGGLAYAFHRFSRRRA